MPTRSTYKLTLEMDIKVYSCCMLSYSRAMKLSPTLRARFEANIKPHPSGCILWTGKSVTNGGYGQISIATGISRGAHQVAWFLHYGRWARPNALHDCDVKLCVNVNHLHEGTAKDNAQEAIARGLKVHKYALDHHNGKLSRDDVIDIRARLRAGELGSRLAQEYAVSQALISQIKHNKVRNR